MNKSCRSLSIYFLMFLFFTPLSAMAGPVNYPGTMCQKAFTGDPDPAYTIGEVVDQDASRPLMVECSVPKFDFDGFLHWSAIESARVRVTEPATGSSGCRLITSARLNDGIVRSRFVTPSSILRFGNISEYNFGNLSPISDDIGYYLVRCDLSAGNRLIMYRINE